MIEPNETETTEAPTTITVPDAPPANDNGDDGGSTGPVQAANDNGAATRAERRNERARNYKEIKQEAESTRRALETERAERQRMSEQIAELRGRQEAYQQQQRQAQGDPYEKYISDMEDAAERHLNAAANATTPEAAKAAMKEYHKSLRQAATAEARRDHVAELRRYDQSRPDPEQTGMKVTLASEFPWLAQNANARDAADGYIAVLRSKGRPNNLATFREACAMAAKDFSLGGTPERASEARRSAYSGVSGREGAGEDGRTSIQFASGDADKLRKMAALRYPEMEANDAYAKWQKEVGPRLARK